ncbi:hypothetical protein RR47_GL000988 [Enterococcus columbae DSM 7374 = ATCC 51263]|nr:hypothetical protein RR47_GL000988 [Enterococcus columbae DSM 7374 = ATCC 51263]
MEKQHLDGWHLIHVSKAHFYIFERGLPEKVVYQLDFAGTPKDYLQLYQDYGWQYCGSCDNWNYFRKPRAAMNESIDSQLFSDQDSKRLFVQKIVIWRILPIVLFLTIQLFIFPSKISDYSQSFWGIILLITIACILLSIGYQALLLMFSLYRYFNKNKN